MIPRRVGRERRGHGEGVNAVTLGAQLVVAEAERDNARKCAVALEQEVAHLRETYAARVAEAVAEFMAWPENVPACFCPLTRIFGAPFGVDE